MNHQNWIFLDDFGGRHNVGIYHGPTSGNLMIYCNSRVVLIDFLVIKAKTYSFFINDEFCEIIMREEDDNTFTYSFKVNKKVETPLNKLREAREKKYLFYSLMILAGFILFVGIVVFLAFR